MKEGRTPTTEGLSEAAATMADADVGEPPVSLAALDPARDELRWERLVRSVAERALVASTQRVTVSRQLRRWARPTIALATAAAAASWILAVVGSTGSTRATPSSEQPAYALARWAATGELPDTAKILDVLGGADDAR